jgi:sugar phosphate isomerase/epimerase
MEFEKQIGISTLSIKNLSLTEAVDAAHGAGLKVFEIVPRLYGGPQQFSPETRAQLREKLACFETVTVHTSGPVLDGNRPANIASLDQSIGQASRSLYLDHVRLAMDLGAKLVTFHPGKKDRHASRKSLRDEHEAFARSALDLVSGSDLTMGFEYFDLDAAEAVGKGRFGLLFDIGHAAIEAEGDMTDAVARQLDRLEPYIVQFHVHGIRISGDGKKEDHHNFRNNNGIDYGRIIGDARRRGFTVPFIFEIGIWNEDSKENLNDTVRAAEEIRRMWREARNG